MTTAQASDDVGSTIEPTSSIDIPDFQTVISLYLQTLALNFSVPLKEY